MKTTLNPIGAKHLDYGLCRHGGVYTNAAEHEHRRVNAFNLAWKLALVTEAIVRG